MNTLELFSGTQSFSKRVPNPVSVDLLPKFKPTHIADMMTWDYKQYPTGYFEIVWASPPCTQYSKARTNVFDQYCLQKPGGRSKSNDKMEFVVFGQRLDLSCAEDFILARSNNGL
jgi:site-specific DNA-cytosine methylase